MPGGERKSRLVAERRQQRRFVGRVLGRMQHGVAVADGNQRRDGDIGGHRDS
jgi:hypothetical protein